MTDTFGTVGICGVGLIGGSLGLALRQRRRADRVIGVGRNRVRLEQARDRGALDGFALDLAEVAGELDVLVFATPVGIMADLLAPAAKSLRPGCVVTDAGSTKAVVVERMEAAAGVRGRFVGSHPMAGSERTGCEHAEADLYEGATCIVTPTAATDPGALEIVERFWRAVGCRVVRLRPAEHDAGVARTSHLPHLAAAALVRVIAASGPETLRDLIGEGFRDTTRVAAGDPVMWRDICLDNADEIAAALAQFEAELAALRAQVELKDAGALEAFLDAAQRERRSLDR